MIALCKIFYVIGFFI